MEKKISFEFDEANLVEALDYIRVKAGVNIVIHEESRSELEDIPITLKVTDLEVGSTIDLLVRLAGMEHALMHGAVMVAVPGGLPPPIEQRVYNLKTLLKTLPAESEDSDSFPEDELMDLLRDLVYPGTWDEYPEADITFWGNLMLVKQMAEVHTQLERVLNALLNRGKEPVRAVPDWKAKVEAGLAKRISVNFAETPLQAAVQFISQTAGVAVVVSPEVFEYGDWVIPELRIENGTVGDVLRLIAEYCETDLVVRRGVLMLGSDNQFEIRIYEVTDLVTGEDVGPDRLIDVIYRSVAPDHWEEWSLAKIGHWNGLFVVSQTERNHAEIARFFATLRRAMK